MKKTLQAIVAIILLGSLTVEADPFKEWNWVDPTTYENNWDIPAGDLITRTLKCGTTKGGPYTSEVIFADQSPPSNEDMAFIVDGVPGNYYCVMTVWSLAHMTQSKESTEALFIVGAAQLGFVPNPPTWL